MVNVLNGYYEDITVNIGTNEQIGNIIVLIKEQLGADYNVERHKELVIKELKERNYDDKIIKEWIEFI